MAYSGKRYTIKKNVVSFIIMEHLNIAVAQFEPKDGDKTYNLSKISDLTKKAKFKGADLISFHEMSITAYTHTKDLSLDLIEDLAEEVPKGKSTRKLINIAMEYNIPILAGLIEKENNEIYNTYICVTKDGLIAKFRKLHPFISKYMSPGNEYVVFDLFGWKCGILICYDNNVIENVRAYDNGIYYAFTNPIGYDGEHLKNGNSMIIDPYGNILSEIKSFDNDITISKISKDKINLAGGWRYKNARRPELYRQIIGKKHKSETTPIWTKKEDK